MAAEARQSGACRDSWDCVRIVGRTGATMVGSGHRLHAGLGIPRVAIRATEYT